MPNKYDNYKFRCSSLPEISLTKNITEKQLETLSELEKKQLIKPLTEKQIEMLSELRIKRDTPPSLSSRSKSLAKKLWLENEYNFKEEIHSMSMEKGTIQETTSMELLTELSGEFYLKNDSFFENDYICGTPDIIENDVLIDIKTCWSIKTFSEKNEEIARNDYYNQMLGYMVLTGTKKASLCYCLVDAPEAMVNDALYRLSFTINENSEEYEKEAKQIKLNMIYSEKRNEILEGSAIPANLRVKKYTFHFNEKEYSDLQIAISQMRSYMNSLYL